MTGLTRALLGYAKSSSFPTGCLGNGLAVFLLFSVIQGYSNGFSFTIIIYLCISVVKLNSLALQGMVQGG